MITVSMDVGGLLSLLELSQALQQAAGQAARDLTTMGMAKAHELAAQRLHTRRKLFVDALSVQQVADGTWFLQLDARARWIDDGLPKGFDMMPGLLESPKAKVSKDGNRYIVVPMRHGPGGGQPASQRPMVDAVRSEMKKRGIPWGKVERDASGQARMGRLHSFSVTDKPLKTGLGPGQGWGPVGHVRQGPNERQLVGGGPGGGGRSFLQGVGVYQRQTQAGGVRKDIMTFRVVSEKQRGTGMWAHSGLEGVNIMDDVFRWIFQEWEQHVGPAVLEKALAAI